MGIHARPAAALAVLNLVAAGIPLVAQPGPALGPKDGPGLPPTDTARVAVGMMAPDFTLASRTGGPVTLSDNRGRKNVVLVFYRGHW